MIINCQIHREIAKIRREMAVFSGSSCSTAVSSQFHTVHTDSYDRILPSPLSFVLKLTMIFKIIKTVCIIMEIFFPDFVKNIVIRVRMEIYFNNHFKEILLSEA